MTRNIFRMKRNDCEEDSIKVRVDDILYNGMTERVPLKELFFIALISVVNETFLISVCWLMLRPYCTTLLWLSCFLAFTLHFAVKIPTNTHNDDDDDDGLSMVEWLSTSKH